jgi:hypothetical protein
MLSRIGIIFALLFSLIGAEGAGISASVPIQDEQVSEHALYLPIIAASTCSGRAVIVNSTADSGPGSLRQVLNDARKGDVITFDPEVFPPDAPKTIAVLSSLPSLQQNCLTIDASQAGVILDGSASQDPVGLNIDSEFNVVRGLQIIRFTGPGIMLNQTARYNQIGGDPKIGRAPTGQGNRLSLNQAGIGVNGASHNRIEGNLIGWDVLGNTLQVNLSGGIYFNQGATYNVVGPNNRIVVSGIPAIEIQCTACLGNVVSRVQITSDLEVAIAYTGPGESARPESPMLMEYDLTQGFVSGFACPRCVVEIYSYQKGASTLFEASTIADANGDFSLTTGKPFSGPGLAAFAVETQKGVTPFSPLTTGASRRLNMQAGNALSKRPILIQPASSSHPSWIGETFSDVNATVIPDAAGLANYSHRNGHSWIRMSFSEFSWYGFLQTGHYSPLVLNDYHDQVIQSFVDNQITVLYNLTFFDPAIVTSPSYIRFKNEPEIQRYLDYVQMIVTRYKGKIAYYETWNEADLDHVGDQQSIDLADYIAVVKRLVPVIKAADPQAKVVLGASSSLHDTNAQTYLPGLLQSELMPLVDGIALHPMYGDSPDYTRFKDYYYNYDSMMAGYKQTAAAHGFDGEWFAEEMVWRFKENVVINEPEYYTRPVVVKYYARGITINRGLGIYPGIGGEDHESAAGQLELEQRLNTLLRDVQPAQVNISIDQPSIRLRHYAFLLPDGKVMVALWNDNVAVDIDPGISATLTIEGQTGHIVTGKDALYGYQQDLQKQVLNGNTVISGFLVKDYPQFIVLGN